VLAAALDDLRVFSVGDMIFASCGNLGIRFDASAPEGKRFQCRTLSSQVGTMDYEAYLVAKARNSRTNHKKRRERNLAQGKTARGHTRIRIFKNKAKKSCKPQVSQVHP